MRIRINVTARDISRARAKGGGSENCPINLAAQRHKVLTGCSTGTRQIIVPKLGEDRKSYYDLPKSACAFIRVFDSCLPVEPFSFVLEV